MVCPVFFPYQGKKQLDSLLRHLSNRLTHSRQRRIAVGAHFDIIDPNQADICWR
jgi:hypothetical protein